MVAGNGDWPEKRPRTIIVTEIPAPKGGAGLKKIVRRNIF
jgi:hypothetical protein